MTNLWPQPVRQRGVALFIPSLQIGGAERSMVDLANALVEEDLPVHLLVSSSGGPYHKRVAPEVKLVDFANSRTLRSIIPLARYLRTQRPEVLISALDHANIVALIAARLAAVPVKTVVTLRMAISEAQEDTAGRSYLIPPRWLRLFYPQASSIVAVSHGVADNYARYANLSRDKIEVIYNPVIMKGSLAAAQQPCSHPWFVAGEPPVILSVGRLTALKDFPTLLQAFAIVRQQLPCRLMILGDGELRPRLEELAQELGLENDFALPGFAENPYVYMAHSAVYVTSSIVEGLPGALIEALACGTPVVSTDCPSGPREVLADGRYGPLVPVRDPAALAKAIVAVLCDPPPAASLRERGSVFSQENALQQYRELFERLTQQRPPK